jgi:hypothetical protein
MTESACPQGCLNRLAEDCVIHRPSTESDGMAEHLCNRLHGRRSSQWPACDRCRETVALVREYLSLPPGERA